MCGIVGYIGNAPEEHLLHGLEVLEYRGYDSAGIAVIHHGKMSIYKEIGRVANLKGKVIETEEFGAGIAHTRWATHGKVSLQNAHPQLSQNKDIAVVHNGIIENYNLLKEQLLKNGVKFDGDTDSEVIAKLFKDNLSIQTLKEVIDRLEGSYATLVVSKNENRIYFARNKLPLYLTKTSQSIILASDPMCFINQSKDYYDIGDGEYGYADLNSIKIYKNDQCVRKKKNKISFNIKTLANKEFNHYMLKEIYQSKDALINILENYKKKKIIKILNHIASIDTDKIYLIGCGTAYHAGLIGKTYLKKYLKKEVECVLASEFIYQNNIITNKTLCIFISQSGETADTILALKHSQKFGAKTVCITNVTYSSLATLADFTLPIYAGVERAVASTKAYFAQCIILYILARKMAGRRYLANIKKFLHEIDFSDDSLIQKLATMIYSKREIFFIGKSVDFITCEEASLKLKEISYINSQAFACGELKHGTLALIDNKKLIIVIATQSQLLNKVLSSASEIKSRGGQLVLFTPLSLTPQIKKIFKVIIPIKQAEEDFMPLQTILPLQKLAYFTAVKKGNDPDMPRNLAKSVTVE